MLLFVTLITLHSNNKNKKKLRVRNKLINLASMRGDMVAKEMGTSRTFEETATIGCLGKDLGTSDAKI